ncbi:HAMP domain-containing histidine kinase [Anaerovorax odorimutans]|uniref:histidine kinase n=1 Tax=Anaerovorax odorimutans TaxID=109327 RepID=A0ABT1RN81_9FIRM|nr:HAMP domain-containing sensor histidine kinase [Anaerovorax odorimutans]MCQ4636639.1 HAMP domain-containing histidine kinase [Anaerovorax odorimutans]
MKYYNPVKILLLAGIALTGCAMPLVFWICSEDPGLTGIAAGFSAAFLLLALLSLWNSQTYIRKTVIALSDLLASIGDLRGDPALSVTEDTLLSKLQSQILRFTDILQAHRDEALKKEREIKSLVSDISHQLKTPIAALKMYGELLEDDTITADERKEYLSTLMSSLSKLEFLMDSLIKMSRLESHIIRLNPCKASLSQTVLEAVMQCHIQAKKKRIDISFEEPEDDLLLAHDRRWTAEAIYNLLDNAVKYTPPHGSIRIAILRYEMFCRLNICDTGPGIPADEQEKVFRRFYRGKGSGDQEGLGIGLYLSRKIITDQGGYIKLRSSESGSTFSVFLPM